jgi:hypothetical protein
LLDGRLVDGGDHLLVQRRDDIGRCLGRGHHADQGRSLHAGQTQLAEGGHIGQLGQTRGIGHGQGRTLPPLMKPAPAARSTIITGI